MDIIKTKVKLSTLFAKDQAVRFELLSLIKEGYSYDYLNKYPVFFHYMQAIDNENLAALKKIYYAHGWPTISGYGIVTNNQAYMIVLHAVDDVPFQKQILALLTTLSKKHEADPSQVAYLTDKIATHLNQLQTYGTQGQCNKKNQFVLDPTIDPAHLNARRKTKGLNPMSDYLKQVASMCTGV